MGVVGVVGVVCVVCVVSVVGVMCVVSVVSVVCVVSVVSGVSGVSVVSACRERLGQGAGEANKRKQREKAVSDAPRPDHLRLVLDPLRLEQGGHVGGG